ncbi:unnamed protein product [Lactuca virosa]|uniref:Uncharacterized protein n=1 Tax=Lactuca virosa TaxID=75947 RepID=A0AAU9PFF8_9ASTR|nr:unnamed protein product [Lactuca virosa]
MTRSRILSNIFITLTRALDIQSNAQFPLPYPQSNDSQSPSLTPTCAKKKAHCPTPKNETPPTSFSSNLDVPHHSFHPFRLHCCCPTDQEHLPSFLFYSRSLIYFPQESGLWFWLFSIDALLFHTVILFSSELFLLIV